MGKNNVPGGVKVISVLYYIGAILAIIFGIMFLFGAGALSSFPLFGALGAGLFVFASILMIILGILGFFVGRGLWRGRNWARVVAIIFAVIGVVMAVSSMISGDVSGNLFSFIFNVIVGGYLWFNGNVKRAFA